MHDATMNIGQPKITTGVSICQAFMIDTKQVQNGGMQIMNVHSVSSRVVSVIVGFTISEAGLQAAPREHH